MESIFTPSGSVEILNEGMRRDFSVDKDSAVLFEPAPAKPTPLTPHIKTLSDFLPSYVTKESLKAAAEPMQVRQFWNQQQLQLCRQFLAQRLNEALKANGITPQYNTVTGDFIPPKVTIHWAFNGFLIAGLFGAFVLLIVNESPTVERIGLACGFSGVVLLLARWLAQERRKSAVYRRYLQIKKRLPDQIIAEATCQAEEFNRTERVAIERRNVSARSPHMRRAWMNGKSGSKRFSPD